MFFVYVRRGVNLGVKLTKRLQKVKTPSERLVTVYQIKATQDFTIVIYNGIDYQTEKIKKGDLGGYVEEGVILGENSWLHADSIIFGKSRFDGVTCGYVRIEDSMVDEGSIIGGRTIITNSTIGKSTTVAGTTSIKDSKVQNKALIIGTIIRESRVREGAVIKCAGTIVKDDVKGNRFSKK